ncbi:hypothetical protein HID58_030877 [Brassica napus]|uniref:aspartate-semialdehyde dehydrogenase n=3 Tax=Brassica napus TaxID=3708 RepID=A0ABQ8CJG0_BRANA|nr:hypothetical protein HID58_030877 [Brassica napus]
MATMKSLIGLINKIQRACTVLGDHGGEGMSLWEALPTVAVVGGQSSGKSSVLESVVGRDFLPRGSGIVTRRPLVLQLHKTDEGTTEYAEFLHAPRKKFTDFAAVRKEIEDETDRITGKSKQISNKPIQLSIYSPNVVNLTLIDLPGLTKVAVEGQPDSIVQDIENMVRSYVEKPNCIILAISPANQDIATSDAIKLAREVDPTGERTFGVATKLDIMDKGTDCLDVLEGRSYRLQHPWVGIVNRSQADINKRVDMIAARRKEREYFETSPEYGHLASRMGSEYLAKLLSQHLETVIRQKIPSIVALINKSIDEINAELDRIGRPIAVDSGAQLYTILELCRAFDRVFKEHLDGGRPGGDRIYGVFDHQLPAALKKLPFDRHLSTRNVQKVVSEADGYQPHLIAPEQGYRRLIDGSISYFKGPAEATVDAVHFVLKELVRKSISETEELKRFPTLASDIAAAANEALERFRDESRKTVLRLVDMESSYLTVEFFRKLHLEPEKEKPNQRNAPPPNADIHSDNHFRKIGSNVSAYINMVCDTLRISLPKAVVYCQVREAKRSLLNFFYAQVGRKEKEKLGGMLDEDPQLMERRGTLAKRLELYKQARDDIDAVAWKSKLQSIAAHASTHTITHMTALQDVLPQAAPGIIEKPAPPPKPQSHFFFLLLTTATMATLTHHTPHTPFLSRLPLRPKPRAFSARVKMSLQESAPSLAVVGVTGAVGQEFLSVLSDRDFPYSSVKMLASKRSAGKRVAFDGREYTVEELTADSFEGVDIALFSAGGSISKEFGPRAAERGTIVVDNSSAFRMVDGVPLVIPEVNPEAMKGIKAGTGKGALIANPNCSTIICLMAVTPLHHHAKVKRMVVSTYQAASGAGAAAMEELVQQTREVLAGKPPTCNIFSQQYAFNLFSHNAPITENGYNEEEMKLVKETRKIWNDTEVKVTATCIRVPVMRAHAESVNLQFENPLDENTARELLRKAPGVYIIDDRASNTFPTPLDVSNKDDVAVGRIRRDVSQDGNFGLDIFVCGDQIRKGAALNAVQIAEMLL